AMSLRSNGGSIAINIMLVSVAPFLLTLLSLILNSGYGKGINLGKFWLMDAINNFSLHWIGWGWMRDELKELVLNGLVLGVCWGVGTLLLGIWLFKKSDVK
ncbi:MAG: hypothetical protein FWD39_01945, partial [Clostridiales bacterium]|nr:hypothetical protein [Clostridiales bacterium]